MITKVPRDDLSFWPGEEDRPCVPAVGQLNVDVAIVGGGFSGLSAAYHLMRKAPKLNIIVAESHIVGSGASGRNTGILRPGVGRSLSKICNRYGDERAKELYQVSVDAVEYVKRLVRSEGLDCDLEDAPHVKAALTQRQARALERESELLRRLGFAADYLNANALAAVAPVPYCGGIRFPQSGLVNPIRLCREMKRVLIGQGVSVYENTPVQAIQGEGAVRLKTPGAAIVAKQVILATNGYVAKLGVLAGQVIPIQTHVSVTDPLKDAELAALRWSGRVSIADKRNLFNYYRLTPDNRIMFGGGRPLYRESTDSRFSGETDIADAATWMENGKEFAKSFPNLGRVVPTKHWSGTVGMTLDEMPVVGELSELPGTFFVGGWSGHGVAAATASGTLVADLVLARKSVPSLPWIRNNATKIPGDPLRRVGLATYFTGLSLMDRLGAMVDGLSRRG